MFSLIRRDLIRPQYAAAYSSLFMKPNGLDEPATDVFPTFGALTRNERGSSNQHLAKNTYQVFMNVSQFKQEEISVKVRSVDNVVVVYGKHEEKADEHGFVCREFTRLIELPEDVNPVTVKTMFQKNGLLIIKGNRKHSGESSADERAIPVVSQRPLDIDCAVEGDEEMNRFDVLQASVGTATAQ